MQLIKNLKVKLFQKTFSGKIIKGNLSVVSNMALYHA